MTGLCNVNTYPFRLVLRQHTNSSIIVTILNIKRVQTRLRTCTFALLQLLMGILIGKSFGITMIGNMWNCRRRRRGGMGGPWNRPTLLMGSRPTCEVRYIAYSNRSNNKTYFCHCFQISIYLSPFCVLCCMRKLMILMKKNFDENALQLVSSHAW